VNQRAVEFVWNGHSIAERKEKEKKKKSTSIGEGKCDKEMDREAFGILNRMVPKRPHWPAKEEEYHGSHKTVSRNKRYQVVAMIFGQSSVSRFLLSRHPNKLSPKAGLPIVSHKHQTYHRLGLSRSRFRAMEILRRAMPRDEEMMTCQNVAWLIFD
jgi:hypothetical protein